MKSGLSSECKECKKSAALKRWHEQGKYERKLKDTPESRRLKHLKYTYGITPDEYEAQHKAQGGCCAICGLAQEVLFVDHCHNSTAVRGLLCNQCNFGLGHFKDSPELLRAAIEYLGAGGSWSS